ncbi:MAG: transglutaminase domain-containing protein [Candidatus Hodarchaeales archaeon]
MPTWVTEKKPPLVLPLLLALQLFLSGLLGALMLFYALSAGTSAAEYLLISGGIMVLITIVLGLPGLFFLRRTTNIFGGGGLTIFLQLLMGYWAQGGPDTVFKVLGSDGIPLFSSFFIISTLSVAITAIIVMIRIFKEDRDYVSKLWNFGPTIILTIILRFPEIYSFFNINLSSAYGWPLDLTDTLNIFPLLMVGFFLFCLFQIPWFVAFHVVVFIIRTYQHRILELFDSGVVSNFYNVLPTLIILFLMMGASLLESFQFGAPRHQYSGDLDPFVPQNVEWSNFATPDWEYDLGNLLDQLTAGLELPDEPLFYVTTVSQYDSNGDEIPVSNSKEPLSYWWRKEVYTSYGYKKNPSATFGRSAWDRVDVDYQPFGDNSYGQDPDIKNATYKVEYLANIAEGDNQWAGFLPATWNGPDGSRVNSILLPLGSDVYEASFYGAGPTYKDSLGVWASTSSIPAGSTETFTMTYLNDFKFDALDFMTASVGSSLRGSTSYIEALTDMIFREGEGSIDINTAGQIAASDWDTIENAYLQIPDTQGVDLPAGISTYANWAPTADFNATNLNNNNLTVYEQATQTMNYIAPDPASVQEGLAAFASGDTSGDAGSSSNSFTYDWQAWLLAQYGQDPVPDEEEDYVEWFLNRRKGVAAHFATALTILLRLQDIPSRFVYGYLVGNTTMDPDRVVMTARWQHAWAEVLVPVYNILTGEKYVEWMIFDPLFSSLYPEFGGGTEVSTKIVNPNTISNNTNIFNTTMQLSLNRVGMTSDLDLDPYIDTTDKNANYPLLNLDPTYLSSTNTPVIRCNDPGTPTNVTVSVAVADIRKIAVNDPTYGIDVTIYADPVFKSGVNVTFFMFKNITNTWQKVPISPGTLNYTTQTDSNGIARLPFSYDLTQGFGTFHFYADINYTDYQGNRLYVTAVTDVNPFNDGDTSIVPDPFTLAFGLPTPITPAMKTFNSKYTGNSKNGDTKITPPDDGRDAMKKILQSLANSFQKRFDTSLEKIVKSSSRILVMVDQNEIKDISSPSVVLRMERSIFEHIVLQVSEEGSLRAISFLRRLFNLF